MKRNVLGFLISYMIMSFYFYLIPTLFHMTDILRFFHLVLFFPLAYLIAKRVTKKGLESYGVIFFKDWYRNLLLGFSIGFAAFSLLYGLNFLIGKYEYIRINLGYESFLLIIVIFVGFGLGSLINDIIVRGLVFYHFKDKSHFSVVFIFAVFLYAVDDIWNEGFSLNNTLFSIALGLSLTYAFFKTNSIWVNTGIHLGLNVVYGLFFGVSGNSGDGIFLFNTNSITTFFSTWMSTIIALIMFIVVYLVFRDKQIKTSKVISNEDITA